MRRAIARVERWAERSADRIARSRAGRLGARLGRWLTRPERRPLLYFVLGIILLVVAAIAFDVHERQVERHARNTAIRQASDVAYTNAINSCNRGKSLRIAVHDDALAIRRASRVQYRFFDTAIRRAKAQVADPNVSKAAHASAAAALNVYGELRDSLPIHLKIPPLPLPCDEVITDPNHPALPHHS